MPIACIEANATREVEGQVPEQRRDDIKRAGAGRKGVAILGDRIGAGVVGIEVDTHRDR